MYFETIFDDLYRLNKEFNRMFNAGYKPGRHSNFPELNVYENQEEFIITGKIPGIKKEDLNITFRDNSLKIEGERKENKNEKADYHLKERRYGKFERSILLRERVDADKIEAQVKNGLLLIKVPKSPEAKPKSIAIK